jgi:hypothetical protein
MSVLLIHQQSNLQIHIPSLSINHGIGEGKVSQDRKPKDKYKEKFFQLEKYLLLFYFARHKEILTTHIIWCRTSNGNS